MRFRDCPYAIACYAIVAPFWAAFVLAATFGVLLGAPTLRLRPDYLAMATVGFDEIARLAFINLDPVTGGPSGIVGIPRPGLGFYWD